MSQSRKILLFAGGAYLLLVVLAFILFGNVGRQEFVPQEEFELPTWIELGAARHQQGRPVPGHLRAS